MKVQTQKQAAKDFAASWKGKGYEKGHCQPFWLSLLRDVYGVERPEAFIHFEDKVHLDHASFIDATIPATRVLIEQKSLGKDLNQGIRQSDGSLCNPFQQAKRYITGLPLSQHPRWVVTCNFAEFYVYDMERPESEPEKILLADLERDYYRLQFLVDPGNQQLQREMAMSIAAGELVGRLYDALLRQYRDPSRPESLRSLNILCVRLVFCLYGEDAEVFGRHGLFHDYLAGFDAVHCRRALIELFKVLDTEPEARDPYLEPALAAFPYVNGGLFREEEIEIPNFTEEIRELLLTKASADFDWAGISPTIFGAVFESTLNPQTRRSGGMHYTSIENIHKVIDPLFLDGLREEFEAIKDIPIIATRDRRLKALQRKLSSLVFLDPACGSGNFLTETYLSLRRLENDILRILSRGQVALDYQVYSPVQVSISQFYGIEINDFAVTVAKTALWIAESQMLQETQDIISTELDFLPLKTNANIVEGNALRLDWQEVVPKERLSYIMGNPPFVGARIMSPAQKADLATVFGDSKNWGNLDYVSGWYKKASCFIKNTNIRVALVSTNSISQGEQVPILWRSLFSDNVHIDFAYRTFRWDSEAKLKAHVHCVIVGFSCSNKYLPKQLFSADGLQIVDNINPYLVNGPNILIESRKTSLCDVPQVVFGSMPNDGGYLSEFGSEQKRAIVDSYPEANNLFKLFMGATEFLHNKERWCLWLDGVSPALIKRIPPILAAVAAVKEMRTHSSRNITRKLALTPMLFGEIRQPNTQYIIIPRHSSENRIYIPLGFLNPDVICGDSNLLMPNANLFHFGILMSNVHNAWMRAVCGRLEMRYRYSTTIVYNNFPWPSPTPEQKARIEATAQGILDARARHPKDSLADLYDEVAMPPDLRTAHQANDRAVMAAYGFPVRGTTESMCVAELMKLYQKLVEGA